MKAKNKSQNVAVIGAGLAGLACAYELAQKGHKVTILEARNRVGGRIETVRTPFTDGFFVEAGAYWLNNLHKAAWNYIKDLKIQNEFIEIPLEKKYLLYCIKGNHVKARLDSSDDWPLELKLGDMERQTGLGAILWVLLGNRQTIGNPDDANWPPDSVLEQYRHMTFKEFLDSSQQIRNFKTGAPEAYVPSPGMIQLIRPWFAWWDDTERLSALAMIQYGVSGQRLCEPRETPARWFRTLHGMSCVPLAFEDRLRNQGALVLTDAPVIRIKCNDSSVRVTYRLRRDEKEKAFDHTVCTIPLTTLKNLEIEPKLSERKCALIEEVRYASVARTYIQCKQPILDLENSAGYTDLPIGNLLDMSFGLQNGPGRLFQGFMIGKQAQTFAYEMDDNKRKGFTIHQLKTIFPQLKDEDVEAFWYKCWDHDPWARGAYPVFTSEQFLSIQELGRAEGRLHFAGEHTSRYSAWMEGALRSGNRAAREIDPLIPSRG